MQKVRLKEKGNSGHPRKIHFLTLPTEKRQHIDINVIKLPLIKCLLQLQ